MEKGETKTSTFFPRNSTNFNVKTKQNKKQTRNQLSPYSNRLAATRVSYRTRPALVPSSRRFRIRRLQPGRPATHCPHPRARKTKNESDRALWNGFRQIRGKVRNSNPPDTVPMFVVIFLSAVVRDCLFR